MTDLELDIENEERARGLLKHFRRGGLGNDAAWSVTHDGTQLVLQFLSVTLLVRHLGPTEYGSYAGIYGIVGPIGGLTWTGISMAVLKRRLHEGQDALAASREFFGLTIVLGIAAA